ncbi:PTH2-domain-containing protein [Mycena pura]|uniref:peptidyl-tRNA hydrolase n=1 Tax=Mycena pura TaxID=153505 RepID=A0AAD7E2Y5_9AGAR|nr:PTH2-domain-containing protein [Mycena pura]
MFSQTPHSAALLILSITSLAVGYYVGRATSGQPEKDDEYEADDADDADDKDLAAIKAGLLEPCKLVFVVRTDLKMTPGKIFAQCGHATLACYRALVKKNPQLVKHWERTGQAKIALKASSENQLVELETAAKDLNLCARAVNDPEVGGRTVLAIGPGPVELVNRVTGKLRLL